MAIKPMYNGKGEQEIDRRGNYGTQSTMEIISQLMKNKLNGISTGMKLKLIES